ncbi:hypothetical protein EEP46_14680 [Escherichia coli]|nr:hypothetical protein [Escherichia coli]
MINVIVELVKVAVGYFTKTKIVEHEVEVKKEDGQIELNKIEVEKNSIHWRNVLGMVLTLIILYSYIIIPFADWLGIALIQLPLEPIFRILMVLIGVI